MAKFRVTDSDGVTNLIEAEASSVRDNYESYDLIVDPPHQIVAETVQSAREWRDQELKDTDWIAQTPDHPQRDNYIAYRTKLRDWPATTDDDEYINNFPSTRPELEEG